jgi:hypothetical protein
MMFQRVGHGRGNSPIEEEIQKNQERWVGKAKGLLQVAFERGLLNEHATLGKNTQFLAKRIPI